MENRSSGLYVEMKLLPSGPNEDSISIVELALFGSSAAEWPPTLRVRSSPLTARGMLRTNTGSSSIIPNLGYKLPYFFMLFSR